MVMSAVKRLLLGEQRLERFGFTDEDEDETDVRTMNNDIVIFL